MWSFVTIGLFVIAAFQVCLIVLKLNKLLTHHQVALGIPPVSGRDLRLEAPFLETQTVPENVQLECHDGTLEVCIGPNVVQDISHDTIAFQSARISPSRSTILAYDRNTFVLYKRIQQSGAYAILRQHDEKVSAADITDRRVYVTNEDGTWVYEDKEKTLIGPAGESLAVAGDTVVIGLPSANDFDGMALVVRGHDVQSLRVFYKGGDLVGSSVAISECTSWIAVGAPEQDTVHVYELDRANRLYHLVQEMHTDKSSYFGKGVRFANGVLEIESEEGKHRYLHKLVSAKK